MPTFRPARLPSIRSKLITLVLVGVLPILLGTLVLVRDAGQREALHVARDAATITRALVAALDRELESAESAARVAAAWPTLAPGTLDQFHAGARALLRPEFPGHAMILSDASGAALLNTHYSYGAAPAPAGNAASVAAVLRRGDALISNLYRAGPDQPWTVSADVPVWRDGSVAYVLSVQLRPRRVADLLGAQQLPPDWIAEVYDRDGRLVARNREQALHVGTPIDEALALAMAGDPEGTVPRALGEGAAPWHTAWSRSDRHGWTVALSYPDDAASSLLGGTLPAAIGVSAALLGLGLLLAWTVGGAIARSVSSLHAPAAALGRGEPLALPEPTIQETAAVADALRRVEGELLQYRERLESLVEARTAELARLNARVATVYATAPVGLCFLDSELRFVMINDYLADLNGVPAEDHIGRTLPELLGETGVAFEASYRHVLTTGRPLRDLETQGEAPSRPGTVRSWLTSYYPVYGPEHELVGINAVVIDITERKRLEQQNRDNEEMFRVLFEASGDAQALLAQNGDFVSANPAAVALFGYDSVDDLLALSPARVSPEFQPDGRASSEVVAGLMRRARAEGGVQYEWVHRRRDGSNFHADVKLTSLRIGEVGMMQATIRDISARVAADAALRASGARLRERERFIRTITDNLPALVSYWDADERLRFANRPLLAWLGRPEEEVLGRRYDELVPEEVRRPFERYARAVMAGEAQRFERELRPPGGEPVHIWGNYLPDLDAGGRVRGAYKLHLDVTELKRTERRLAAALREAEAANRAKSEFLGNMSHEIRTPMHAIVGLARLLEEAPLAPRERGHVAHIQAASKSLLGLLNDLLDYSRVEAGQLALEQVAFRLDTVLQNIAILAAPAAWDKGVEPVFAVAQGVPDRLVGDPLRLEQVLLNLVGNAVKFTASGEVVLAVELAATLGAGVRLRFAVRDTGIGIAAAEQERMFEAFTQGDSSTRRKHGGAGLGLAIARRLVAVMGGELAVESEPGRGSTFRFEVELALAQAPPSPPAALPFKRVLVLEPNASARAALTRALAGHGWQAEGAADAAGLRARLPGDPPCELLFAAAEPALLASLAGLSALPPPVLTGADPEAARRAGENAGLVALAVLAKPFTPGTLTALLTALSGEAPEPAGPALPLAARLAGLRVLVVEDNPVNQEVARHVLLHAGAYASFADNGQAALDLLDENHSAFDAILMDLQMPVLNGFEASAAIRARGLRLPIVAMTANAMEEDRRAALAAGMDAHLAKPIDVDELVATLARVTGRAGAPTLPATEVAAPAAAVPAARPTLPGVDLDSALARFGGDAAAFAAVFRRFAASQEHTVAEIRGLLAAGARREAAARAHRLRGVAANLGATDAALLAQALEHALPTGEPDALEAQLAALQAALDTLAQGAQALAPAPAGHAGAAGDAGAAPAAPREALAQLLVLLENNNMAASTACKALLPALRAAHGAAAAETLEAAVDALRFERAAALLRDILEQKGDA